MGTSKRVTEDRTQVGFPCRLYYNKDVQLKTLAIIWQGSRQPNLANKVIWTEQVWSTTRYVNINIITNIIVTVTTITILKLFLITVILIIFIDIIINIVIGFFIALCNICRK
jgi:hypothetical protein